jgi:hypothetical protein
MGKKKPSTSLARGFATTSIPSQKKLVVDDANTTEPPSNSQPSRPTNAHGPKSKHQPKVGKIGKSQAGRESPSLSANVSLVLSEIAKDARVSKIDSEVAKHREEYAGLPAQGISLSSKAEHLLLAFLKRHSCNGTLREPCALGDLRRREVRNPIPEPIREKNRLIRELNLVYMTLEQVGFSRALIHSEMILSKRPWELQETLFTMCIRIPAEQLPNGFVDKVYHHQQVSQESGSLNTAIEQCEFDLELGKEEGMSNANNAEDIALQASLDTLNLDDIDIFALEAVSSTPKSTSRLHDEFSLIGWTGKVPKQLLRDTMVREDRNVKISFPEAKPEKGLPPPSSTSFRVRCVVNGVSYSGSDYCRTKVEAEHYAATIALYKLSKVTHCDLLA